MNEKNTDCLRKRKNHAVNIRSIGQQTNTQFVSTLESGISQIVRFEKYFELVNDLSNHNSLPVSQTTVLKFLIPAPGLYTNSIQIHHYTNHEALLSPFASLMTV